MRTTDCVKAPGRRRFSRTRAREEGPGDPELGPRAIGLALVLCTLIVHYSTHFVYKRQPPPVLTRPAREPRGSLRTGGACGIHRKAAIGKARRMRGSCGQRLVCYRIIRPVLPLRQRAARSGLRAPERRRYGPAIRRPACSNRRKSAGLALASSALPRMAVAATMQSTNVPRRLPERLKRCAARTASSLVNGTS